MANQVKPLILRLPPKLADALQNESISRDVSVNWIVMEMLGERYGIDVTQVVRRAPKKPRIKEQCETGLATVEPLQQPP